MKKISAVVIVALIMLATVQMAAATYTYTTTPPLTGTLGVCAPPMIDFGVSKSSLNFGKAYPGAIGLTDSLTLTLTQKPEPGCSSVSIPVTLAIDIGAWTDIAVTTTHNAPSTVSVLDTMPVITPITFTTNVGTGAVPGNSSVIITITGTY